MVRMLAVSYTHLYKMAQGRNRATELIDDRLKSVGLSFQEINGRYPGELSGGQLQRASLSLIHI